MLQNKLVKIKKTAEEGFTLIELLVVIGILAILMGIVLIAINPAHQFALSNDTNRRNAVAQILSAVGQYEAENKGNLPPSLTGLTAGTKTPISNAAASPTDADLCTDLLAGATEYMPALPTDPKLNKADIALVSGACPANYDTGYEVSVGADKRVTIWAPNTEAAATEISVTR